MALTPRVSRGMSTPEAIGGSMGWWAIGTIVIFLASFAILNRIEFGRFD